MNLVTLLYTHWGASIAPARSSPIRRLTGFLLTYRLNQLLLQIIMCVLMHSHMGLRPNDTGVVKKSIRLVKKARFDPNIWVLFLYFFNQIFRFLRVLRVLPF